MMSILRTNKLKASPQSELFMSVCEEVLDRSAELEWLLRSSNELRLVWEKDIVEDKDISKEERYQIEWSRLREYRSQVLRLELLLDASVWKIIVHLGDGAPEFFGPDGYFVRKIDRAISDHSDVFNPGSGEATQLFSSNYLEEEERFPFGAMFGEKEIRDFFRDVRSSIAATLKLIEQ